MKNPGLVSLITTAVLANNLQPTSYAYKSYPKMACYLNEYSMVANLVNVQFVNILNDKYQLVELGLGIRKKQADKITLIVFFKKNKSFCCVQIVPFRPKPTTTDAFTDDDATQLPA